MEMQRKPVVHEGSRRGRAQRWWRACSRERFPGRMPAIAVAMFLVLVTLLAMACTPPAQAPTSPCVTTTGDRQPRPPWRVGLVLADNGSATRLQQGKALAVALVCALQPGDAVVVVRQSDFRTVVSAVVPGDALTLAQAANCRDVPIGGPSLACLAVAAAEDEVVRWRAQAAVAIASVESASTGASGDDCRSGSGWPRDQVVQLLLSLQPDPGQQASSILIVMGDSDRLGGSQPLQQFVQGVHVFVAPYVLACGDPANTRRWFQYAVSVDLYPAESPASNFPAFLLARLDGQAQKAGAQQ